MHHLVPAAHPSFGTGKDSGFAIVVRDLSLVILQQAALEIPKHRCGPGLHHPHDDDWRTGIIDECRDAHGVFSCDLRLFSVSFHVAAGCWSHIIGRRRVSHLGRRHRHRHRHHHRRNIDHTILILRLSHTTRGKKLKLRSIKIPILQLIRVSTRRKTPPRDDDDDDATRSYS
mmetsp:Transcript_4420/g.4950  ORF Transcript_4420/g.4950 Transcript_4420/m.4950 type:complete len:172 (+) Transcript_4420:511-1026(+)